jgi:hypothetical protein
LVNILNGTSRITPSIEQKLQQLIHQLEDEGLCDSEAGVRR